MAENVGTIAEATIYELAAALAAGKLTSEMLTGFYLERIAKLDHGGPRLNSVLEINPDALFIARALDTARRQSGPRGPLHGIPVLIKDNINTADKMHTSAGSQVLADSYAPRDSYVAATLRRAGAVILGKTNLTEFANFMAVGMPPGYSSRGGQVRTPYKPDTFATGGSSAGSGVAVAASLCAAAVGTETDGSIVSPAHHNSIVGIKPTVGLISRSGIVPISFSQDTAGPLARTVTDAALLLGAMTGIDADDSATGAAAGMYHANYTRFLDAAGLKGARIGLARAAYFDALSSDELTLFDQARTLIRAQGAVMIDVDMPAMTGGRWDSSVFTYEFKVALNAYLSSLGPSAPVRSLQDIIAYCLANPKTMLRYGQQHFLAAEATSGMLTEPEYILDRLRDLRMARQEGIDATMDAEQLDALLFPSWRSSYLTARAGYPAIQVPAGYTGEGHPFSITFAGRAWSEPVLIRLAYSFEQASRLRVPPALEGA